MREVAVGTDDEFEEDLPISEERLEKLLKDKVPERSRRGSKRREEADMGHRI